ncbi:MAG: prolyl-tRNA synthetase associated domain-containing protein [Anaerolineaceae bacterium]|nr:prolyl-tRNA synthetase associated domain-containing protein [Anaerolineaceae bacterium]
MNEANLLAFLTAEDIAYQRFAHPPVLTSAEAAVFMADAPGVSGKNLFLRDKKGCRFFLLMTLGEKRIDLKRWGKQEGLGKPSFSDPQELAVMLGVSSGAVGPLALVNDLQHRIEVFADQALWDQGVVRCHSLVNTASLILTTSDMQRFFALTGHAFKLVDVPPAA